MSSEPTLVDELWESLVAAVIAAAAGLWWLLRRPWLLGPRPNGEPSVAGARRLAHAHAVGCGGERGRARLRDMGMLCALLSARGSEVNGLLVGDVDLIAGLVHTRRQVYPGSGGLVTKQTKGRAARTVPVLEPLRPVLHFCAWTVGRPTRH